MFALLKKKNPYAQPAKLVYAQVLSHIRNPEFYRVFGVPDTQEGRFDLLLVHLFLIIDRMLLEGRAMQDFNQALFDVTFADMDQTLREIGIGDTGVPKRMRRMMKAFNGRMHAYSAAMQGGEELEAVLLRNLYAAAEPPDLVCVSRMKNYVQTSRDLIKQQPLAALLDGRAGFAAL